MKKDTVRLLNELQKCTNVDDYTKENEKMFMEKPLIEYLEILLKEYKMKRAEVIKRAALTTVYGYQIFDGRREPKRDKVIQLAIGFGLSLPETQRLLKCAGHSELYPKVKRDVLFIYAINNKYGIEEIENLLFHMGEKALENIVLVNE